MLSPREGMDSPLTPTYRDHFDGGGNVVWFTRDARGRITALHLGESRMWDMVLQRLP